MPDVATPVRQWHGHALRRRGDSSGGAVVAQDCYVGLAEAHLPPPSTPACCSLLCRGDTTFKLTVHGHGKKNAEKSTTLTVPFKQLGQLVKCVMSATSPTITASTSSPPPPPPPPLTSSPALTCIPLCPCVPGAA